MVLELFGLLRKEEEEEESSFSWKSEELLLCGSSGVSGGVSFEF